MAHLKRINRIVAHLNNEEHENKNPLSSFNTSMDKSKSRNKTIPENRMKKKLLEGKPVFGTMVAEIRQPSVMQFLANANLDFVIIDNEHGPFGIETIGDLSRTAVLLGISPIVRVPDFVYSHIAPVLDSGAQGLMIPRITNAQQVKDVVRMMKFPPIGQRGSALGRGYCRFEGGNVTEIMNQVNQQTFLIIQIETAEAMQNLSEILSVKGVDCALVGPNDLSIALGVPGDMKSPVLHSAIAQVKKACDEHGVICGLHSNDIAFSSDWAKTGIKVLSYNSDIGLLINAAKDATQKLRDAAAKKQ